MEAFESSLLAAVGILRLEVSDCGMALLGRHFEMVSERNLVMNLTRITDPAEAAVKHYADSLALVAWAAKVGIGGAGQPSAPFTVLDVGTGAGFPAVPIAVVRPQWSVTAIDSTRKKVEFMREAATKLGLSNLLVEHAHTAHWGTERQFDIVTFRALSKLGDALRQCSRFVTSGGHIVAYKSADLSDEERAALSKPSVKGLFPGEPFRYELAAGEERLSRALYVFKKD